MTFLEYINDGDIDKMIEVRDQLKRTLRVVVTPQTRDVVQEALDEAEAFIAAYEQHMMDL